VVNLDFVRTGPSHMHCCFAFTFVLAGLSLLLMLQLYDRIYLCSKLVSCCRLEIRHRYRGEKLVLGCRSRFTESE